MRLRDWPPRRIGKMWLIGIALQVAAVLIVPPLLGWEYAAPHDVDEPLGGAWLPDSATLDSIPADTSTVPPLALTLTALSGGDTVVRIGRDSSFLAFRTSGGTVEASPDVEKAAGAITTAFVGLFDELARLLTVLLIIVAAPTLAMLAVTVTWAVQRRRGTT